MIKIFNLFSYCSKNKNKNKNKNKKSRKIEISKNNIKILETNFKPCEVYFIDYDEISDITIK